MILWSAPKTWQLWEKSEDAPALAIKVVFSTYDKRASYWDWTQKHILVPVFCFVAVCSWSKLSSENIASSRLAAPGTPRTERWAFGHRYFGLAVIRSYLDTASRQWRRRQVATKNSCKHKHFSIDVRISIKQADVFPDCYSAISTLYCLNIYPAKSVTRDEIHSL